MRRALLAGVLLVAVACSDTAPQPDPAPTSRPLPAATSSITVSDEVPSMQELRDTGLSDEQAQCFIREIDPDETGRVQDAELFMAAMANCLQ